MPRSIIHWIFTVCALMGLALLAIAMVEPVANAGGVPHPEFPGMVIGGDGAARLEDIGLLAFLFHSLLLLLVVLLCTLGISEDRRSPKLMTIMAVCYAFMMLVCWQMFSEHQTFLESGETGYFLGFPTATAWQMYGTWLCAMPLILLYTLGFREYIFSAEDEAKFQQLIKEAKDRPES